MAAEQRAYNERQEAQLDEGRRAATMAGSVTARSVEAGPLAERMYRPPAEDIAELRRQQAEFKKTKRAVSRENAWLAFPALAPVGTVLVLQGAGAISAGLAPAAIRQAPLQFVKRDPYLRVGDNFATRAGRRAHAALRERIAQKPGWRSEPGVATRDGRILRPDVQTPPRLRPKGKEPEPYQMELKPNTPSGRAAAARAVKKYEATGIKTRPIFYDPKSFI
jgi:hypothetical protein